MKLNKFTWNNGTQSSPIVLTNKQIKKLIAIGKREDIETTVKGYITTSSRKIQKFFKYVVENQFPELNIICDEEIADSFRIQTSSNIIKEGTREFINIISDDGITHDFLKWNYEYSNFEIDGDISEQNIKDRIRVENGYIVVDDPEENASWSVTLKLTAYPIYIADSEVNNLPLTSRPNINLTIIAKKIEDINIKVKSLIPINSSAEIDVTAIPKDSTKLKDATYTYTTSTPDIININTSSLGTEIIAKKQGTANIIVTLHACNNTVTKSNSITVTVYDLRPVCFIIDQRGSITDPSSMVSENYTKNADGSLTSISASGSVGNPSNNILTWLRQNTHAYVGKFIATNGKMRLKQLDDTTRKKFADGTSSVDYITSESGDYDVWLKFNSDIYWKTEPYTPVGLTEPDPDYVLITLSNEIPIGEDITKWQKWSEYKMVGVYKATQMNNKLYSLSGKRPVNKISQIDSKSRARARGNGFTIVDYQMNCLFAILFYGWYSSLDSQLLCGYGTTSYTNNTYYPKLTGLTDDLGMTDTNSTNGNGATTPNEDQIKAGEGSDIKSVNFWGLDNYWGDITELIDNLHVMQAKRPANVTTANINNYLDDYLNVYPKIEVTENGITREITKANISEFAQEQGFIVISDSRGNIQRLIKGPVGDRYGYVKKMQFGDHADIAAKEFGATGNTSFCDYGYVDSAGYIAYRSGDTNRSSGGVGHLSVSYMPNSVGSHVGSRLLFEGTEDTIYIIDDATETL